MAPSDLTVLLLGETGVGKGLAARALHALSAYSKGPFIHVNCGPLSQELGDSELFGREDETATSEAGKVEQAKDGTLFLDEIGEMTLEMQDKVLRLLEERTFERVGGDQTLTAQTRMVAATSRDLKAMVQAVISARSCICVSKFFRCTSHLCASTRRTSSPRRVLPRVAWQPTWAGNLSLLIRDYGDTARL